MIIHLVPRRTACLAKQPTSGPVGAFNSQMEKTEMASITKESNGRRLIQFMGADKRRRTIRLGKISQQNAEAVKLRIEYLVAATIPDESPRETAPLAASWMNMWSDVST